MISIYLGFKCKEDNQLDTHITGGLGLISDWPFLHHLATKVGSQVIWEKNKEDLMDSGSVRVFVKEDGRELSMVSLRKEIQYILLNRELKGLLELKMQGRLIDLKTCDYLLSQNILKNAIWSDALVNFWFKLKHNVIRCNYTLSRWYRNISQVCPLDGYRIESMLHILNSCKEFRRHYSKRHDKLVDKIYKELQPFWSETFNNKTVGTSFAQLASVSTVKDLKPDLVLKSRLWMMW